jgi:hypothetical protein
MTDQPMIEAERALIAHPWAVRVNLPTDLKHAAQLARRALDVAAYARLDAPQAVARAVEVLEGWAVAVDQRVKVEGGELARSDLDAASYQRRLERSQR